MTAIMMAAAGHMGVRGALDTTVTVGSGIYDSLQVGTSSTENYLAYGYQSGVDYFSIAGTDGSIGDDTFRDGGGTSRTVSAIYWTETNASGSNPDDLFFCLNATGITNSDTTFVNITYNGQTYTRSSATYDGTTGSCSTWWWSNISPNGPTSGTVEFVVRV